MLWMMVTKDIYELPVVVAETCKELANMIGINEQSVRRQMWYCKKNGAQCQYVRVKEDED